MKDFLVNVAAGAMTSLVEKLGTMLTDGYKLLTDVRGDIKFLKDELEAMKTFLLMMADVKEPDHQAKLRANALRELSYDIEDKIDKFMLLVDHESSSSNYDGFRELLNKSMEKIANLKTCHKIAKDIKDIKSQLKDVADRYERYKIDESSRPRSEKVDPRILAVYKDASELVGIDGPRDAAVELISSETGGSESANQIKVISIFGCGGLGKTTLARQIFEKIAYNFECRAFVSISRRPNMTKILSSILCQLCGDYNAHAGVGDLQLSIDQIRNILEGKRYFIIVDDIWDIQTWKILDCALFKNSCGGVIMTTTRIYDVAISCYGSSHGALLCMQPLSIADSKKLLFKRIFGCEEKCPSNLKEASEDILTKCGGLPLAIIAISSLLATRKTKKEWERVRCSIGFGQGRNPDFDAMNYIISLSYFDLPLYLRNCLLYLTMFPEDSEVEGQLLVRRWISEGLVHGEHGEDLVELGETYLYELSNRSLIQLVDVGHFRMELGCRVHDTVLDFLIYKATEENFCTLLSKYSRSDSRIRRLTLLKNEDQGILERLDLSHARSLAAFGSADQLPSVVQSSALRVLDLSYCSGVENDHIKDIVRFFQLRYLSISSKNVSELPTQIGDLVYLQTLDASGTKLVELPESVTHLKNLAHIFVPDGTKFPDGIGKMEKLQEIGSFIDIFKQSLKFLEELGNLINLRRLKITWDTDELDAARLKGPMLIASLIKLDIRKLHSLSIEFNLTENDATLLAGPPFSLPALESIREIKLHRGKLCWINKWLLSLVNLERLSLRTGHQRIEQQDVEMIGSIPTLLELVWWGFFVGPIIISSNSRTFQQLKYLELRGDVTRWTFEAGAMPCLKKLFLWIDLYDSQSYGGFDYSGFLQLPSLASVGVHICYMTAAAAYVQAVREALDSLVDAHANRPLLNVLEDHVQKADEC